MKMYRPTPILQKRIERWTRSEVLADAIPRLKKLFEEKAVSTNDETIQQQNRLPTTTTTTTTTTTAEFPLFTPKFYKSIWRSVPIDPNRKAAVLVPLVSFEGKPSLLFTTRSQHLNHPGDVSFPGGHYDDDIDDTIQDTAIRETREELLGDESYPWDEIEIIGQATPLPSKTGIPVFPVIGVFPYEIGPDNIFPGNPEEVDDVFCVGLQDLIDSESSESLERLKSKIPNVPVFWTNKHGKTRKIWGLTAIITRPLLHKLFKPIFRLQRQ